MAEEDQTESDETQISIDYSPAEVVALLQLLDYLDIYMLKEGVPMGAIGMNRRKIVEEIVKDEIVESLQDEQEDRFKELREMMDEDEIPSELEGNAFQ